MFELKITATFFKLLLSLKTFHVSEMMMGVVYLDTAF